MAIDYDDLEQLAGRRVIAPPKAAKPVRTPMRWEQLASSLPPPRKWIIEHWLTTGATLMAGSGGVGKTLVAQTIATALALGKPFLDAVAEPCTVLFWACEDDHDELWRRQCDICRYFGIQLADLEDRLYIEPRLGMNNTLFRSEYANGHLTAQHEELRSQVQDYGAQVTFIDNIGQTFGGNENDRHHVTSFVNSLSGLAGERPHATVLLGHPAKANGSEYAGSGAWENAVRMRWFMGNHLPDEKPAEDGEEETDENVRYISKRKVNYTVKDYRKLMYQDGVFAPERSAATSYIRRWSTEERNQAAEDCVIAALNTFEPLGMRTSDSRTSPDYFPKKALTMHVGGDFTLKELGAALDRLRMSKKVVIAPFGVNANRTKRDGLVVARHA